MKGILKGLGVTFSTFTRKPVTVEYPEERHALPVRQRSFPVLTWDFDHDEPFCTGCNVCIRNCPVDCMTATMHDNPKYAEGTSNRRKIVEKFWIDYARCMRCNICVEVCPFEAIVMDNNWSGHEHSAYDRRDLHMDIDELTRSSREGLLTLPFRPQDSIEVLERAAKGEEPPEISFKGARPDARQAMLDRIAQGLPAAIQEREPEKPKAGAVTAAGGAAAAGGEVEILSESKDPGQAHAGGARGEGVHRPGRAGAGGSAGADRPLSEHEAGRGRFADGGFGRWRGWRGRSAQRDDAGRHDAIPAGRWGRPEGRPELGGEGAGAAHARRAAGEGTDGGRRADPGGDGEDAVRPRERPRAERHDLGDAGRKRGRWRRGGGGSAHGHDAGRVMRFPPGVGDGPKGDPNSPEKVRARRMRAERKFKELTDAGEPIPDDIAQTLYDLGSDLAPNGTIWEKLNAASGGGGGAAAAAPAAKPEFPPGIGIGPKGDPNSPEKVRARRMRAERAAKAALEAGQEIPADVLATINELGGTVPERSA